MKMLVTRAVAAGFFIFFMMAIPADGADFGARYIYRDPIFPERRLSLGVADRVFLIGGAAIPMDVCGPESEYLCVTSDGFYFHFPRKGASEEGGWKIDGIRYRRDAGERISIWGRSYFVYRIHGEGRKMHVIFLYSPDSGLMGFSFVDKKTGAKGTYLLDGSCGFGASLECGENGE